MLKAIVFDWNGTLFNDSENALYPGARKVLVKAREKYKIGLYSKGDEKERLALLEEYAIREFFDAIVIEPEKGTPQLLRCLKLLDVQPEEVLVVDDYAIRGIAAGNELGCQTCWVTQSEHSSVKPDENTGSPTYEIDEIAELLDVL